MAESRVDIRDKHQLLLERATQSALDIKNNITTINYTYIFPKTYRAGLTCDICCDECAEMCSLHMINCSYTCILCPDCFGDCRRAQKLTLGESTMNRRIRLLTQRFNIYYGDGFKCILCCDRTGCYKNNELAFICEWCKAIGTRMLCVDVLMALQHITIVDIRYHIVTLIVNICLESTLHMSNHALL